MKRRILGLFIILILIGLTVGMKLATSPKVDQWLQESVLQLLEKNLHVKASMGGFEKNLLMTRVSFNDVTLEDLDGSGGSIKTTRLVIEIDPYAFLRGTLHLKSIQLEGVVLDVTRRMDGSIVVEPLFPLRLGHKEGAGKSIIPMKFEIGEVTLIGGSVSYTDEPAGIRVMMNGVIISLSQGPFNQKEQRIISVRSRDGEFRWRAFPAGHVIKLEAFRADLAYGPEELAVNRLELKTSPFSVELTGSLPFRSGESVQGDVSVRVNLGGFPWMLADSKGEVDLKGTAGGELADPSFSGTLSGKRFRVLGREMEDLQADIHADARGCQITNIGVRYRAKDVEGKLSLGFGKGIPFTLEAGVSNYPIISLAEEVHHLEFPLGGDVSTTVMVSGNISGGASSIAMLGEVNIPLGSGHMALAQFHLTGDYLAGNLRDLDLGISTNDFKFMMNGSLTTEGPDLKITATQDSFALFNVIPSLKSLKGSVDMTGEITGKWGDVQGKIDAIARLLQWENYSLNTLRVHADIDRDGVDLPMVSVETGSSTIVGQIEIPWDRKSRDPRFSMEITDGLAEDLLASAGVKPFITGRIMGRVEAFLTAGGWKGSMATLLQAGKVLEEDYDRIDVTGVFGNGEAVFRRMDLLKANRLVQGSGKVDKDGFEATFKTHDPLALESVWYLEKLKVFLGGDVSMETTVRGNMDGTGLAVDAGLVWEQITFDGRTWQGGSADLKIRDRRLTGKGSLLDGIFKAVVEVDLGGEFPFSGTINTDRAADRDALNNLLGVRIPPDAVSGSIKAEAGAEGILKNIRQTKVSGTINYADLWIKGIHFRAPENVSFTYYPPTGIRFIDAALWSGESIVAGTLLIAPDTNIEGNIDGNIDLHGFSFLKPTVDGFSGQSLVQIQASGTLAEPVLSGSIQIRGAECTAHIPFDLPVSELTGDLEIVGNRLRSGGITGLSNGGTIRMDGDLILERFKPVEGELRWKAEGVPVSFPEGLETVNRADIVFRFSGGSGVMRGTVSMDEGRFERQVDIDNLIALIGEGNPLSANDSKDDLQAQGGDWLTLDVEMETVTPVTVDIKLLRGTAGGNLHLQGTAARPVLAGRMEMLEGAIEYRGHVFDVISGSVGFFNPTRIEPAFDFSARTEVTGLDRDGTVTDYTVDLLASGVPEKFRLDLVSSPALSEIDIVSLLTWGAVGEQAFASRSGLSAAEATLLLTRELKGTLETGVRQLTGFDRVVINPSSVTSSGERTTRIQVDKKLSDSFYLTYSTPVITSAEQEVFVKYRISDSFSLIGEQTGEQNYGLDLDFQFQIR